MLRSYKAAGFAGQQISLQNWNKISKIVLTLRHQLLGEAFGTLRNYQLILCL